MTWVALCTASCCRAYLKSLAGEVIWVVLMTVSWSCYYSEWQGAPPSLVIMPGCPRAPDSGLHRCDVQ